MVNRLYIGDVHYKGVSYPGEYTAIIDRDLWDTVQGQLARNAVKRRTRSNATGSNLLTALIETDNGFRLTPSHCVKQGQRYRYYITSSQCGQDAKGWRLPAPALEKAIMDGLHHFLMDRQRLCELASSTAASALQPLFERAATLANELREAGPSAQREIFLDILQRTIIAQDSITLYLNTAALRGRIGLGSADDDEDIQVTIPITIRRRGVETRLVIEDPTEPAKPDAKLVDLVVQARRWFNDLKGRTNVGLHDLGERYEADPSDISRVLPLAFLAPDVVEAILDGRQPPELTAARLKRMRDLPIEWQQQRRYLGCE